MTEEIPRPIVVQSGSRFWSRLGWIGFFVCALLLLTSYGGSDDGDPAAQLQERFHSGDSGGDDKVAIISISGVIMDGHGFIKQQIDRARKDDDVKAVVLRVDSPGGTVYGSDFIYHHLNKLREERNIPIIVSMGSVAASGGYYVSMAVGEQEDAIFAEPTTTTGSIGVIIPHYDFSGLLAKYDVENDSIASHPRKQMLSMTRDMPEEHRELLQTQVMEMFDRFKEVIYSGRPNLRRDDNKLTYNERDLATGEVFSGPQAKEFGLVDRIGFIEDAIERAKEVAELQGRKVRVIEYREPPSLFPVDLGLVSSRSSTPDWARLAELTAPRSYFLTPGYFPTLLAR